MFTVLIYQRSKSNWICLIENPKFSIYSSLYAASTACCCILCQTHCVPLITYLEFRVLARNTSETPRDRWHYEANAGLYACVAVLLWGERSGLVPRPVPRRFPGVSNGRHRISSQPFFNLVETMLLSTMQHVSVTVPSENFDEDFSVTNSAAFNTFECFRILGLDFPWFVTSVFSVVLYFICLVIYGLINSIIDEFCI